MTNTEYLNERVPVILHRPESERKEFRTVTVNGTNYQIAFGRRVLLPRYVALIIEEALSNEEKAKMNAEEKSRMFSAGKSSLEA